jgi:hypothetical protein
LFLNGHCHKVFAIELHMKREFFHPPKYIVGVCECNTIILSNL